MSNELVNKEIREILSEHPEGGIKFFDALDEMLRTNTNIFTEYCKFLGDNRVGEVMHNHTLITTGSFGLVFRKLWPNYVTPIIHVQGGLRHGKIPKIETAKNQIIKEKCILLDDSFYSGSTRDAINIGLENWAKKTKCDYVPRIVYTFVIYNGSPLKPSNVHGMFNYYE